MFDVLKKIFALILYAEEIYGNNYCEDFIVQVCKGIFIDSHQGEAKAWIETSISVAGSSKQNNSMRWTVCKFQISLATR